VKYRTLVMSLWVVLLSLAGYFYFFQRQSLQRVLEGLSHGPPVWAYVVYLALCCVRGFTLVPATYLFVAGLLDLPPLPLYGLTVAGIIVSSAAVYYFAEAMRFDRFFERRYPTHVARLRELLARRELPIVIAWSLFPLAPTDLICYVCGALKVDLKKCLLGVALGQGALCAVYIFLGAQAVDWLR
jgi:uncharacterized membrane protein YdjX (TVP38/TMEM64 family)